MSVSQIAGNRNSTPEAGSSSLRPPSSRAIGANHHLRASADMGVFSSSPLSNRGIRPSSEVYFNRQGPSIDEDVQDKAAQQWIADIDQYETTLEEMAAATLDQDFKDELSAIEQWFRVLSEPERTAALYQLLQQTTGVQQRFFIQVLQQMAKNHPMSGVLSPANFGEKDPMSQRMSDAMGKLSVEGSRNSVSLGRPPPSPGAKRNSGLDPSTINSMFPDAVAAIAKEKADFTRHTGTAPPSNRNSAVGDRSSLVAPTISAPEDSKKDNLPQPPSSPWGPRSSEAQRPKSSSGPQPMGQFAAQPPPSAGGLRSPRMQLPSDQNIQNTTLSAPDSSGMGMLSPYGSWGSQMATPMVPNFQQSANQADMVANATAMKLAALSTVNNRLQLDDPRKFRRARSSEGQGSSHINVGNMGQPAPPANFIMTNELGQVLTPQQAATLQAQQLAAMNGRRSRPSSPGLAMQGAGNPGLNFASPQNNGFLSAYDTNALMTNSLAGLSLSQYGLGGGGIPGPGSAHEGYLSDHSEIQRGRSPRGRRGSSKPPEDPTDPALLGDIPAWLRSLRLHKYTDNLKDLRWDELVALDDEGLERRGVNALGARRKMLKVFEQVREAQAEGKL
ncbi:SAM domain-containing protein [Saccharata proteae CBS 121410]|uniref:RNA-binding protein VTS1 n=1 Tax=Saccharata proteae CBS 121410 TaxID=1314787 RepID=A0A9P4HRZ5_9PEZI|nr:SAM domain-containing protein [Saccharata proteae CBS 121410]